MAINTVPTSLQFKFDVRNYILLVTNCDPYLWFRFIYRKSGILPRN